MAIDPYRTLGLEPGATPAEVRRAYRRLAKAFHPDSAGEAALPRFLAIHEAYDQLISGRRPASAGRPGAATPAEPWRADPARARAAREQARSRRPRPGGPGAGPGAGPDAGPRSRSAAGAGQTTDGARRRGGAAAGSSPSGSRAGDAGRTSGRAGSPRGTAGAGPGNQAGATGSPRPGARRRPVRKATLGSTSYDEARDPADPSWAGAAWYGPTSGEYWTVNPREYADPRKHGPEYQSRARRGPTSGSGIDPEPDFSADGAAGSRAWTPPRFADSAQGRDSAQDRESADRGPAERRIVPPASLATFLGSDLGDPVRRLGFVLLAWAPLGVGAAAIIGQVTGCSSYSASCGATEPLLPWLAQAIILGVLLLVPALSRILATGTIALVLALVPIAGVFVGFGGAGRAEGSVALVVLLTAAWVAGVAVAVRTAWRSRAAGAST